MVKLTIEQLTEQLLLFAFHEGLVAHEDMVLMRNRLLEFLGLDAPDPAATDYMSSAITVLPYGTPAASIADVVAELYDRVKERGAADDEEAFSAKLMGLLTPLQSYVSTQFAVKYYISPQEATDWFYRFSQATDYIRTRQIAKNQHWLSPTEYGDLEITINLSKPEKDPKLIAAAKSAPQTGYPLCVLCAENVGFSGGPHHPARQNHRVVPVDLCDARWYLQYSPYVYYNEHCIVLNEWHEPMRVSRQTFNRLFAFLDQFPHYFIGSNADLPIVGGSILSHDHFQGGRHVFPMEIASVERPLRHPSYPSVSAGIVKWPMSVIRLTGSDKDEIVKLAASLYERWKKYTDELAGIKSFSTNGKGAYEYHNTVTPIARMRGGQYELDIVLRNNRTSDEHPLGIFHPHADVHHIKKENIGLIEVMGLAVLPGRLQTELALIARVLAGEDVADGHEEIEKHRLWIGELIARYAQGRLTLDEAYEAVRNETGQKFARVLSDCAVFKRDAQGMERFERFLVEECGFLT